MKNLPALTILLLAGLFSTQSNAAFMNGSFEDFGIQTAPAAGTFGVYTTLPGWTGFNSIEIHPNGFIADSQEGGYYAELNADPAQAASFALEQTFDTMMGQEYKVSFYAQARKSDDGAFNVSVSNASEVISEVISDHMVGSWTLYEILFTAASTDSTLRFASLQAGSDTIGHFLDNIQVSAVPIPAAVVLLAGGLLGLGAFRKREVASKA